MVLLNVMESTGGKGDSSPQLGMNFDTLEDAWKFWLAYGRKVGFEVRVHFKNESKKGEITSRGFVCANEGQRKIDKRNRDVKRPRAHTRTDCPVRISLKLIRETQKYQVYDFFGDHNHDLQRPEATHLLSSQCEIPELYGVAIDLADDSGIKPREAYELMSREAGGPANLPFRKRDHLNRLRDNRKRNLAGGAATSMLRYFYDQTLENSSFQHIEQVDDNGKIKSVFWADAKMIIDYAQFGDVITFATTYGTNKQYMPLGVFVGFNHFREIVIFGATLLYNESIDSFKWLFEVFLATHSNKHPKTIFTDQDQAMANALKVMMPNTYHGLCTWHISQNALKHLRGKKKKEPDTNVSGKEILRAFRACMYEYDDENEFKKEFDSLLKMVCGGAKNTGDKRISEEVEEIKCLGDERISEVVEEIKCLGDERISEAVDEECAVNLEKSKARKKKKGSREDWLNLMFELREQWAECYMKNVVTLGMRSTQLSESFNKDLKSFLRWNMDIVQFFKHFERVLAQKRKKETESDFDMKKKIPRVKANIPILQQAGKIYTPKMFEIFQEEWEMSMAAFVVSKSEGQPTTEYHIGVSKASNNSNLNTFFYVTVNNVDQTVICSCNKFNRVGILCGHALKVLDKMDVKLLPEKYIIKRWTRDARKGMVEDANGKVVIENPKLDTTHRYRVLARKLLNVAIRAADFEEVSKFVAEIADALGKKVDEKIHNLDTTSNEDVDTSNEGVDTSTVSLHQLNLISKEVSESDLITENPIVFKEKTGRKGGKRIPSCVEQPKKKPEKVAKTVEKNENDAYTSQQQSYLIREEVQKSNSLLLPTTVEDYEPQSSYMKLLMGDSSEDLLPFT